MFCGMTADIFFFTVSETIYISKTSRSNFSIQPRWALLPVNIRGSTWWNEEQHFSGQSSHFVVSVFRLISMRISSHSLSLPPLFFEPVLSFSRKPAQDRQSKTSKKTNERSNADAGGQTIDRDEHYPSRVRKSKKRTK